MGVTRQQVAALYVATFNRATDAQGLSYWAEDSFTDATRTIEAIAKSFFDQTETQFLYPPGGSDADFVTAIYRNLFNRDPDAQGLAYWTGAGGLGGTVTRDTMIEAVKNGAQGTDKTIIVNKTQVALYYADMGLNGTEFSLAGITEDTATVTSAKALIDQENRPHDEVVLPGGLNLDYIDALEMGDAPHAAIGQVEVDLGATAAIGTGFLISPRHILTNAHVVYDDVEGDLLASHPAAFYPGLNGDTSTADQYQVIEYSISSGYSPSQSSDWPDDDLALLKLDHPIGSTLGYLQLEPAPGFNLEGVAVQSAGYPSEDILQDDPTTFSSDFYQWEVDGTIDDYIYSNGAMELSDSMEMTGGASGSPVYYEKNDVIYFTGVYSGALIEVGSSNETQVAAAIDQNAYNWILGILQQDGYYTDYTLI